MPFEELKVRGVLEVCHHFCGASKETATLFAWLDAAQLSPARDGLREGYWRRVVISSIAAIFSVTVQLFQR